MASVARDARAASKRARSEEDGERAERDGGVSNGDIPGSARKRGRLELEGAESGGGVGVVAGGAAGSEEGVPAGDESAGMVVSAHF